MSTSEEGNFKLQNTELQAAAGDKGREASEREVGKKREADRAKTKSLTGPALDDADSESWAKCRR